MRKESIIWVAVFVLSLPCICRLSADEDRFAGASAKDRGTWQLAVNTAARRALEAAEGLQTPDADRMALMQRALIDSVLKDAKAHVQCKDSRTICAEKVRQLLKAAYGERLALVLEVANEQSSVKVFEADVSAISGDRLEQAIENSLDVFEKTQFDSLFSNIRSQAVAVERQALDQRVAPPPFTELDQIVSGLEEGPVSLQPPWTVSLVAALQSALTPYAGRNKGPVFEEISTYADEVAARMTDGIRQQIERQMNAANEQLASEPVTSACLADAMERHVLAALETAMPADESQTAATGIVLPVYPLFSSVKTYVRVKAGDLETERFCDFLRTTPVLGLNSAALTEAIQKDAAAHAAFADSRTIFINTLASECRPQVAAAYVQGGEPGVAEHFVALLEGPSPAADEFAKRISDGLDAMLPEVRGGLADAQYGAIFGAVDKLDRLPDPLLLEIRDTYRPPLNTLDEALTILRRGDMVGLVEEPLPGSLLEETVSRLLVCLNGQISKANTTVNVQLDLLRELEQELLDSLKADVAEGRRVETIREDWERSFMQRWVALAETSASPYTTLTPPAMDVLNKTLRQIYDTVLREQMDALEQELKKQTETAPLTAESVPKEAPTTAATPVEAETPPAAEDVSAPLPDSAAAAVEAPPESDAVGPDTPVSSTFDIGMSDRLMPDVLLILSGTDADRCEAVLTVLGEEAQAVSVLDMSDPEKAADELFTLIRPVVGRVRENAIKRAHDHRRFFGLLRRSTPEISVQIVVESNAVRHRMSLLLLQRMEAELERCRETESGPAVDLDWQAGLSF